ncbi:MAG: acyl-CoA dehydrogenase family protein [Chloroflexi bacterium]|nr:acyl-CoA dehydrogenase family protein [Chloroflexota bacterium]
MDKQSLCFRFSEEQERFRQNVREFAQREIAPYSAQWDRDAELPRQAIKKMAEMKLLGILAPREVGGQQKDYTTLGIAVEEIARADASCAILCSMNNTLSSVIKGWGEEHLRSVIRGEKLIALATTEPGSGSDLAAMKTMAELKGNYYVLNGVKRYISVIPGADTAVVGAKVPVKDGSPRINLFRVDMNLPGITTTPIKEMGLRAHQLGDISFKDVKIPITHILGEKDEGLKAAHIRWNAARSLASLIAAGIAMSALDAALDYVKKRHAYGRPIGKFEAVQFPLVESYTRVEAGRLLAYKALWMLDNGIVATREAAMAKWFSATVSYQAIDCAMQVHGGAGYTTELGLEQKLRDCRGLFYTQGTIEIMKMLIGREMLGNEFLPYK